MKISTSLVVALGLIAGCNSKQEEGTVQKPTEGVQKDTGSAAQMKAPEAPKMHTGAELAADYQKCVAMINDSKFDDFKKDCVSADFKAHHFDDPVAQGSDALVGFFTTMKKAMPDWKLTPQIVMVSGRNILAVNLVTGTHSGELAMPGMPPIPATSKKIGMFMFHKLAINEANRATEEWAFDDPATMMGQLGQAPKDAPPVRPAVDKGIEGAPIVVVTADDAKEKANLETFKKGADAVNAHKLADFMALMTDDALAADQADGADRKGKKDIETGMKEFLTGFPDVKVTASETYAAGDWVAAIGKMEGTHTGDMGKLKKTGKKVNLDFAEIALIKDGKVSQLWRFRSGMQSAMQLGLMKPPATK
jgi:predicted ester cyclase